MVQDKIQLAQEVMDILSHDFPSPKSELNFNSPFELLVAVILSAQCTDKRVNIVTKQLFAVANTPQQLADMPIQQLEQIIKPCGFYHNKAKFLVSMSQDVVNRFDGVVPNTLEQLSTLAGVGRKTANVVYAVAFGGQAIAVDTHVFRVSNRIGLANATNVLDTEKQLMQVINPSLWSDGHHYLLLHGRYVCKSRNPQCDICSLKHICTNYNQR